MALSVVGAMDEQAADRRWKGFSADRARFLEVRSGKTPDATERVVNSLPEFR
jgi:hypothetical protein